MSPLHPNCRLWIYSTENAGVFGDGKARLLAAVEQCGSLRRACAGMGMSYRKAWGDLRKAEACLGMRLVERVRGGTGGGETRLTADGRRVLAAYRRFRTRVESGLQEAFGEFKEAIRS
jgi:molybdate transport system regulatory protein